MHKPCLSLSADFWGGVGFLLSEEENSNCRPCPGAMGTPQFSGWTGRMRVPPHLEQQELLLDVASHSIPDGCLLWKAKENQVTLYVCQLSTLYTPNPWCGGRC